MHDKDHATTHSCKRRYALILGISLLVGSNTQAAENQAWSWGGDLRFGFFASESDTRDGGETEDQSLRSRLRSFVQRDLSDQWRLRGRAATWMTSEGNDWSLAIEPYRDSNTGTAPGDIVLDELYVAWRDPQGGQELRLGRMQTGFTLPVVPDKSLDRVDSSNVGIGWTDGLHWRASLGRGWESHLIAQHNHRRGSGNTARAPLDFSDSNSRISGFFGLRSTQAWGPISMRMLSLSWLPDALAADGVDAPRREDYLNITAKAAAQWPLGRQAMRLLVAGEIGHAFNTPSRSTMRIGQSGDVGGNAFQLSANLYDFRPGHHIGVAWGRIDPGWLISGDFNQNIMLYEVRYQTFFHPRLRLDARLRLREELEQRLGSDRLQEDRDLYLRLTWSY